MVMYSLYFHFKRNYNVMLIIKIKGNNSIELHAIKSTGLHNREEEFFGIIMYQKEHYSQTETDINK